MKEKEARDMPYISVGITKPSSLHVTLIILSVTFSIWWEYFKNVYQYTDQLKTSPSIALFPRLILSIRNHNTGGVQVVVKL